MVRRAFAWRLERDGYLAAVEEFLESEYRAMESAYSYADVLDRQRVYDLAWVTDVVRH